LTIKFTRCTRAVRCSQIAVRSSLLANPTKTPRKLYVARLLIARLPDRSGHVHQQALGTHKIHFAL